MSFVLESYSLLLIFIFSIQHHAKTYILGQAAYIFYRMGESLGKHDHLRTAREASGFLGVAVPS